MADFSSSDDSEGDVSLRHNPDGNLKNGAEFPFGPPPVSAEDLEEVGSADESSSVDSCLQDPESVVSEPEPESVNLVNKMAARAYQLEMLEESLRGNIIVAVCICLSFLYVWGLVGEDDWGSR